MPIYSGIFRVNEANQSGFRILADGKILLNEEIPSAQKFVVSEGNSDIKLDLSEALKNEKRYSI